MKRVALTALICGGLVISSCGGADKSSSGSTAAAETARVPWTQTKTVAGKTKPKVRAPDSPLPKKLVVNDIEVGHGRKATVGDRIKIEYVGIHWNGEVYVDSWTYPTPPIFELGGDGSQRLDYGLDLGLRGMRVGGRREVMMPERLISWPGEEHGLVRQVNTFVFVVDLLEVR